MLIPISLWLFRGIRLHRSEAVAACINFPVYFSWKRALNLFSNARPLYATFRKRQSFPLFNYTVFANFALIPLGQDDLIAPLHVTGDPWTEVRNIGVDAWFVSLSTSVSPGCDSCNSRGALDVGWSSRITLQTLRIEFKKLLKTFQRQVH